AIATALPWSIRLGVATVPELPTAALTVFAVATIAARRHQLLGAVALLAATLSRYEPWPVAAAFAALCVWDAARGRDASPASRDDVTRPAASARQVVDRTASNGAPGAAVASKARLLGAAALAALGPAAW